MLDTERSTKIVELQKHYGYPKTDGRGFKSEEVRDIHFLLDVVTTLQDAIAEITAVANEALAPERYRLVSRDGHDFIIPDDSFDEFLDWSDLDTGSDEFNNWQGTEFDDFIIGRSTFMLTFENPRWDDNVIDLEIEG